MGPGAFSIGEIGTPLDLTAQVRSLRVVPSVDTEDPLPTLSGESLSGARTYTWAISGTVIQDLTEDGMFDYTWTNKGSEVPFTFTPSTAAGRTVTGTVIVDPLELGGDVGAKNTTDFEWTLVGDPILGDDL
jgi:hypothetical protein